MSKPTINQKEARKDKDLNVTGETVVKKASKRKTTNANDTRSVEDWPSLDGMAVEKDHCTTNENEDHNNNEDLKEKSVWEKKSEQKNGQLMEQSSEEPESNGSLVCGEHSNYVKNIDETQETSDSGLTANDEQEVGDLSKEKEEVQSSGASATSDKPATGVENVSATRGNKKKGSKNRWRPLVIEPQSSKHHERIRGQRVPRRRDNPPSNVENGGAVTEEEARNTPPDKSYRGNRRVRGRGYSSFGRPAFRGRSRNMDGSRSQTLAISDEYSANITYYTVNYDGIASQPLSPARPVRNGPMSPTLAQTASAAYVSPTGTVPATFVSPYYATFAPIAAPTYDPETLKSMIRKQIEYYFSEENLQRDFFLRRKMDSEGYLPLSLIASFQRVQGLTQDVLLLIEALESSSEVDLSEDHLKVRTKHDPLKWPIFAMRFPLSANETGASVSVGDSNNAIESGASSDLHPDVPDFIPGQPYGYGYDGAQPPLKFEMAKNNGTAVEADRQADEVSTKKVFCYADVVKKKDIEKKKAAVFRQELNDGQNTYATATNANDVNNSSESKLNAVDSVAATPEQNNRFESAVSSK